MNPECSNVHSLQGSKPYCLYNLAKEVMQCLDKLPNTLSGGFHFYCPFLCVLFFVCVEGGGTVSVRIKKKTQINFIVHILFQGCHGLCIETTEKIHGLSVNVFCCFTVVDQ